MQPIHIRRFSADDVRGQIEPEDRSWFLVIDADGVPHLHVQTSVEIDDGAVARGYIALDDLLPDDLSTADVMKSTALAPQTPEEAAACASAADEYAPRAPCPRM